MKKMLVSLACSALVAQLAFAQSRTEEAVTVTGTLLKTTTEEATASNYQPMKTLVVRQDNSSIRGNYVLTGRGHVLNKKGEIVRTAIKPGAHVQVVYLLAGNQRTIDHVIVD